MCQIALHVLVCHRHLGNRLLWHPEVALGELHLCSVVINGRILQTQPDNFFISHMVAIARALLLAETFESELLPHFTSTQHAGRMMHLFRLILRFLGLLQLVSLLMDHTCSIRLKVAELFHILGSINAQWYDSIRCPNSWSVQCPQHSFVHFSIYHYLHFLLVHWCLAIWYKAFQLVLRQSQSICTPTKQYTKLKERPMVCIKLNRSVGLTFHLAPFRRT